MSIYCIKCDQWTDQEKLLNNISKCNECQELNDCSDLTGWKKCGTHGTMWFSIKNGPYPKDCRDANCKLCSRFIRNMQLTENNLIFGE